MRSVAIVITTFRNPARLAGLLDNMLWAGIPDIPVYVFEDRTPGAEGEDIHKAYKQLLCEKKHIDILFDRTDQWSCMQGVIDFALRTTDEDWIIYIPDDVMFTRGGLWNEYAGILTYGRDFVGGIQAPFWNAQDLVQMGVFQSKEDTYKHHDYLPPNPHWNNPGVPRKYINLNGAGFSLSRKLYEKMGGWPHCTWRLDEYAGYQAWKNGMVCITLPGPPRIHYFGGATPLMPQPHPDYSSVENWIRATGKTPSEAGCEVQMIMDKIEDGNWDGILRFFQQGGSLL